MATKNIVPNDNGEGGIGVTGKRWNTGFINTITGNLTGNVTGNASGTAATVTGAAQSNITSLGTLTTLTVDNVIVNGTTIGHTSDTDLLTLADQSLTVAGALTVSGTGNSAFNGPLFISHSSGDSLTLTKDTTEPSLRLEGDSNKDFVITVSGELLTFTQNDGSTDILTLDHDTKNASFTGNTSANIVTARDNMFVDAGQFYIGADDGTTDDTFRQSVGSGAFKIESRESGTWTERFKIDTVGDVSITNNLFIGSGKALYVGGTAAANALDEYEEGSGSGSLYGSSSSGTSHATGDVKWTRIGDLCFVKFRFTNQTTAGNSGVWRIDGLPFVTENQLPVSVTTDFQTQNLSRTGREAFYLAYGSASLYGLISNNNGAWTDWAVANTTGIYMDLSITYKIN